VKHYLTSYAFPRFLQWLVVIVVGVTVTFIIPRLLPINPVEETLQNVSATSFTDPRAVADFKKSIEELYGLQGTPEEQYVHFWERLFRGDLGPALSAFPTPVTTVIRNAMPWTAGLLGSTILISWLLGLILGTLAAYFPNRVWTHLLANSLVTIYPIPYFILGLLLVIVFAFYIPIFPLVGGAVGSPSLSLPYLVSILQHAFLPALSLVLLGTAFRFIMARALAGTAISSDYVTFAETAGLPKRTILFHYVMRNSLLPQVTDLALSLGAMFEGALITEVVFSYPGIGFQLYTAILQADYNLILGVTLFSIVGVATAALLIDLSYPLFDPRVRHS
jgi:peptide/nickel transport system permease protein